MQNSRYALLMTAPDSIVLADVQQAVRGGGYETPADQCVQDNLYALLMAEPPIVDMIRPQCLKLFSNLRAVAKTPQVSPPAAHISYPVRVVSSRPPRKAS